MAKNANGLGSIYFDKTSKIWRGSISLGRDEYGKLKRKTFTGKTQKVVKEKMDTFLKEFTPEVYLRAKKVLFRDYATFWYSKYKNNVSDASAISRGYALDTLLKKFPDLDSVYMSDLTVDFFSSRIPTFLKNIGDNDFTEHYRVPLKMICKSAIIDGYMDKNPIDLIKATYVSKKSMRKPFTNEEQEKFLNELNKVYEDPDRSKRFYYPFYLFLFWTGLRVGERSIVTWDDVDFVRGTIEINKTITKDINGGTKIKDTTKTKVHRTLILHPNALKVLKFQKEHKEFSSDYYIFTKKEAPFEHMTPDASKRRLQVLCEELDIPKFTFHFLRHNFISMLMNSGAPVTAVRELAGHKNANTTLKVYFHSNEDTIKETLKLI